MAKKDAKAQDSPYPEGSPFGSPALAEPSVGDDAHDEPGFHGHAGYPTQADMDIRWARATGDSRQARFEPNPPGT